MQRTHIEFMCVCRLFPQQQGQSTAPEEGALTQILSAEPLQRENFSSFLCLLLPPLLYPFCSASMAHILSSQSFHPATFIILSSLDHSSPPLSVPLFFALLVFGTDLTTALQYKERFINTLPFFLYTCKVYNSNPGASSSHGRTHLFLQDTQTHTCGLQNI